MTATDGCGSSIVNPRVDPFVEDNCGGYAVTYRWIARDDCGNETEVSQTFNVLADSEAPTFDVQPSAITDISCNDPLPTQQTLTASDACGTTNVVASIDPFVENQCGGYAITYRWTASDACGNSTETTQTFNVLGDSEGPVFDAQPATIANINCNDALPLQQTLTASDACGTTTVTGSVDPFTEDNCGGYAITYRWTATDVCGNTTETTQTFNVLADSEGPVFDAQPAIITNINCEDGLPVQEILTATDACGTTTVVPSVDTFTEDNCGGYTITYRWTATDDCGNTTETSQSFNVIGDDTCLLYTSPSPRDKRQSRMPSSA